MFRRFVEKNQLRGMFLKSWKRVLEKDLGSQFSSARQKAQVNFIILFRADFANGKKLKSFFEIILQNHDLILKLQLSTKPGDITNSC